MGNEMAKINLTFYMEPVAQGRPRTVVNVVKGKPYAYTPDKTATAKALIKAEAMSWANKNGVKSFPIYERGLPLYMAATFIIRRPPSIPKRITMPARKPDLDRYCNLLLDSLTDIFYADDSQIVLMVLEKEYVKHGQLPRIEVTIREVSNG